MGTVFVGDVGTIIELDVGTDVTAATRMEIRATKPDGTKVAWTASLASGETTVIAYVTQDGDLDQAGAWKLQAYVELPGWKGRGEIAVLDVHA